MSAIPRLDRPWQQSMPGPASSASPRVRTPSSSQALPAARSAGSMFASGMMQRSNPICAASRTRKRRLRNAANLARKSHFAKHRRRLRESRGCARSTRSPPARRDRTRVHRSVIPPAIFTKTSSPITHESGTLFENCKQQRQPLGIDPIRHPARRAIAARADEHLYLDEDWPRAFNRAEDGRAGSVDGPLSKKHLRRIRHGLEPGRGHLKDAN